MELALKIVLAVLGVVLLVAAIGAIAATRRNRSAAGQFSASLTAVDRHLAAAIAADHGWNRTALRAAARRAFTARHPGVTPTALELIQIVDEPGTASDLAIYRVTAPNGTFRLTLGRREGAWYGRALEEERGDEVV